MAEYPGDEVEWCAIRLFHIRYRGASTVQNNVTNVPEERYLIQICRKWGVGICQTLLEKCEFANNEAHICSDFMHSNYDIYDLLYMISYDRLLQYS